MLASREMNKFEWNEVFCPKPRKPTDTLLVDLYDTVEWELQKKIELKQSSPNIWNEIELSMKIFIFVRDFYCITLSLTDKKVDNSYRNLIRAVSFETLKLLNSCTSEKCEIYSSSWLDEQSLQCAVGDWSVPQKTGIDLDVSSVIK